MKPFEQKIRSDFAPPLPEVFKPGYNLGGYPRDRVTQIMWKYLGRMVNCERAWVRINSHCPDTLIAPPMDILELSTAHGAMLEIWRHFGHRVVGTDFPWLTPEKAYRQRRSLRRWQEAMLRDLALRPHDNPRAEVVPGWPYQPIIESLGLDVRLFDGGVLPYPLADKSFDLVCCYQAIEAYARPARWREIVDEFCRIARKTVLIGFNPLGVGNASDTELAREAHAAWLALQRYDRNGFRTTFFEIGSTRRGMHPVICKLQAVD